MTRITTPFGFASTADDVAAGVDLAGRRAVVTGGASGIGVETARTLARAGAEVTLAVRDDVVEWLAAQETLIVPLFNVSLKTHYTLARTQKSPWRLKYL
ncbi:SDR family NAD(P)-dependent oxidoreductase [Kutzneria sp. 744]|uniref:SDR family NAD(P)-dependent oxidoreductase n=1 Tax=Kutzneria sp. (strain 744) TaxID=345341 RepID=UPI0004AD17EA